MSIRTEKSYNVYWSDLTNSAKENLEDLGFRANQRVSLDMEPIGVLQVKIEKGLD